MTENQTVQQKSVRRNRVAAAACFAAALIMAGVVGTQSATAAGAAHNGARPAAVAAPGLGSAHLVQSEDFQKGMTPVGATIELTGRDALSACSGEETMRDLTKGQATAYASVNWTFDNHGMLRESAASAPTGTAADAWEKQLVALVQDCQDEPAGHWHYGAAHTLTVTGGTARWYPAYNGDGGVAGGVAVLRSGTKVAIVEVTGQAGSVEGTATAALNRLSS
ncbi:hypothetical protein [Streptomyces sp. CB01881]|uniref:hypothetical protein n=1 Tax=Streptomyces sp. CB01881 TaxID=2078691 RepID=UPI000CDCA7DA|nr:hypothetical protein [Streptomyces sp. CB01881]AUY50609.1 hypothetical protein C2142_18550 [Streptomyces sp. CB01881]TYC73995.1 hypothetical protein EH183_18520 [Streptomyces sp. CB01881]